MAEITTSDRTEQESLSIALKGSYGHFSAQGSFSSSFSQAISNKALHITSTHEGGDVPKEATSLEEVQATASTFAATVEKNAVPYAALLDQYSIWTCPTPRTTSTFRDGSTYSRSALNSELHLDAPEQRGLHP